MKSSLFVALQILSFLIIVVASMGCTESPFENKQTLIEESTSKMRNVLLFAESSRSLSIARILERY